MHYALLRNTVIDLQLLLLLVNKVIWVFVLKKVKINAMIFILMAKTLINVNTMVLNAREKYVI
jgi:hypothetical protein